jgi:hypothetical protein
VNFGDPWNDEQRQLIDIVISAWARESDWPVFQYVQHKMADNGLDAATVMTSFPILGSAYGGRYSDVMFDRTAPAPREDAKVKLAVSALARHRMGEEVAKMFVEALKIAAQRRASAVYSPTAVGEVRITRNELCREWRWEPALVDPLRGILESEWPPGIAGLHGNPPDDWSFTVGPEARQYADLTMEGYLDIVRRRFGTASNLSLTVESVVPSQEGNAVDTASVFIVHGHDAEAKHHVARIVARLTGADPIILDEQRSGGNTVIEKFEQHSGQAAFAVVLLTPDDEGGVRGGPTKPRARQKVIFELGYFFAKLGRGRVVALTKGGVELPSDIAGIVYISLDGNDWPTRLGKEMKHFPELGIDMNRL